MPGSTPGTGVSSACEKAGKEEAETTGNDTAGDDASDDAAEADNTSSHRHYTEDGAVKRSQEYGL